MGDGRKRLALGAVKSASPLIGLGTPVIGRIHGDHGVLLVVGYNGKTVLNSVCLQFVRELDGWSEVWEPNQQLLPKIETILEDAPSTLVGTKALVIIFSSVMSTYGFLFFDDGALVRKVIYKYGKCVTNIGEPLAFEADFDEERGHDEDFVWTALREITGRSPDLGGSYAVYDVIAD